MSARAGDEDEDDRESETTPKRTRKTKRPPIPRNVAPEQWEAFWVRWDAGQRDARKIAPEIGAGVRTVYRWIKNARAGVSADKRRRGFEPAPPELGDDPVPSERPGWDELAVARKAADSDKVHVRDRLQAVRILQHERHWRVEHEREGKVDWATVKLEDIPHEHRSRLAGVLAEVLIEAKAPALGLADTTEAQAVVWYQLGLLLHPDDAEEVMRTLLQPGLAAALARAEQLTADREAAARQVSAGGTDIAAEEYIGHV